MAMLIDGPPSTIDDLSARDFDLNAVAGSEGIDLTAKLQIAASDLQDAVESMMIATLPNFGGIRQCLPELRQIAVTPQLKRWHTFMTLRCIYQDLYASRLNDRYQAKMQMYRDEEVRALDTVRTTGLGIVHDPLPKSAGPTVTIVPSDDPGGTMYLATTYVNLRGEEGLPSDPAEVDTQDGTSANISVILVADNAIGWNIYAGLAPAALARQNAEPLGLLDSLSLAPGRLIAGSAPGNGQTANTLVILPRRILRG